MDNVTVYIYQQSFESADGYLDPAWWRCVLVPGATHFKIMHVRREIRPFEVPNETPILIKSNLKMYFWRNKQLIETKNFHTGGYISNESFATAMILGSSHGQ